MANPPASSNNTQRGQLIRDDSNYPLGWKYTNITSNTTSTIKSGAGVLHGITINGPVATGTITVYDNTSASGTPIATITIPANPIPMTLQYDVAFSTGLTIVTAVAVQNITVSYI